MTLGGHVTRGAGIAMSVTLVGDTSDQVTSQDRAGHPGPSPVSLLTDHMSSPGNTPSEE